MTVLGIDIGVIGAIAVACIMVGVDPTTVIYEGDPWLYSLSRNKHRRHLSTDQIVLVSAELAKRGEGAPAGNRNAAKTTGASGPVVSGDERPTIAQVAKAAGVSKTMAKSAKVVLEHGTEQEKANVRARTVKVRKTADTIHERRRATASPKPSSVKASPSVDPIDAVACDIIAQCGDGRWRPLSKIASTVKAADTAARQPLIRLGEGCVTTRVNGANIEYRMSEGDDEAYLRRSLAARDQEITTLKKRIAEQEVEIERLRELLAAPSLAIH